eukprot:358375-Chlamydomonas_euryale.AAC.15
MAQTSRRAPTPDPSAWPSSWTPTVKSAVIYVGQCGPHAKITDPGCFDALLRLKNLAVLAASRSRIPCCFDLSGCSERIRELALCSRVVHSRAAPSRAPSRSLTACEKPLPLWQPRHCRQCALPAPLRCAVLHSRRFRPGCPETEGSSRWQCNQKLQRKTALKRHGVRGAVRRCCNSNVPFV